MADLSRRHEEKGIKRTCRISIERQSNGQLLRNEVRASNVSEDRDWSARLEAIDREFGATPRPAHFTRHSHCCECAEADHFFQALTPATLLQVAEPPECLPLAFLSTEAFHYFMPAFAHMLARKGQGYCLGDFLFFIENRLDTFNADQEASIRDLLYAVYIRLQDEIHRNFFDYEALWRILNRLECKET